MPRQTYHIYVLTHFHKTGTKGYTFKCTNGELTLTEPVKRSLISQLNILFNENTEILELVKLDRVRVLEV